MDGFRVRTSPTFCFFAVAISLNGVVFVWVLISCSTHVQHCSVHPFSSPCLTLPGSARILPKPGRAVISSVAVLDLFFLLYSSRRNLADPFISFIIFPYFPPIHHNSPMWLAKSNAHIFYGCLRRKTCSFLVTFGCSMSALALQVGWLI